MALQPCKECGKEISSAAKACPHCGKKLSVGGCGCLTAILAIGIISFIAVVIHTANNSSSNSQSPVDNKAIALSQVTLGFKWTAEAYGNVMEASFTVKNNSAYNIKDLEITCHHFAKSGTEIDSNTRTIFDVVKAHSTKKFPNFNMGLIHSQAAQSACKITNLSIAP